MMCCAASGVIFIVCLSLSLGSGLKLVPEMEEITSVSVKFFCYSAGVNLFSGMQIVMVSFEFDGNCTEPDKSICKGQSCQMVIAWLRYRPV